MNQETPLRILTLDGGGVRGLSEVLILKNLFQRIDFEENGRRSAHLPEPWQYFDLICGTSTGGLLALMLGRLKMVHLPYSYPLRNLSHIVM
jgi:Patatin